MTPIEHNPYFTLPDRVVMTPPVEPEFAHLNISQHALVISTRLMDDVASVEVDDFVASDGSVAVVITFTTFGESERILYTLDAAGKLHIH